MNDSIRQLDGVLETALYVSDLARARAFYVDLFGCELLLDTPRLVALSVAGRSVLLLFQRGATEVPFATPGGIVPGHGGSGVQHLAFAIAAGLVVAALLVAATVLRPARAAVAEELDAEPAYSEAA